MHGQKYKLLNWVSLTLYNWAFNYKIKLANLILIADNKSIIIKNKIREEFKNYVNLVMTETI